MVFGRRLVVGDVDGFVVYVAHVQLCSASTVAAHRQSVGVDRRLELALGLGDPALDDLPVGLPVERSEEHTSELQSQLTISYAVFCLRSEERRVGKECS